MQLKPEKKSISLKYDKLLIFFDALISIPLAEKETKSLVLNFKGFGFYWRIVLNGIKFGNGNVAD